MRGGTGSGRGTFRDDGDALRDQPADIVEAGHADADVRMAAEADCYEAWASPLVGVATGLVTGATGVFVIPAVPYLQSLRLEKEDLIQALGLSFTVSTAALAIGLLRTGALVSPTAQLTGSMLALLPALAGMCIGQRCAGP